MILVDTNVWSEATKAQPDEAVRNWAARHQGELYLSTIVLAELRAGTALMAPGKRRDGFEAHTDALLDLCRDRILPFDEAASRRYGQVLESARRFGRPMQTADAMIAATALVHGLHVATRDSNDFAGAGVVVINPWNA